MYKDYPTSIAIVSSMHIDDSTNIESMVKPSLDEIREMYPTPKNKNMYGGMDVGTCCYCKGDCNPQSQCCGPCMRGPPPDTPDWD